MILLLLLCGWLLFTLHGKRAAIAAKLVHAKIHSGEYDTALRRLRRLRFAFTATYSRHLEAFILHAAGRLPEAEALYREALQAAQTTTGYPCQALYYALGDALRQLGRYEEAESFLQQAIGAGDNSGGPLDSLAVIRVAQGRLAEALSLADQAVAAESRRVTPRYLATFHADRAWMLALQERADDARASLQLATPDLRDEARDRANLNWRTGLTLAALGQGEEAVEQFRIGCQIDPQGWHGGQCLEELRKAGVPTESKSSQAAVSKWRWGRPVAWVREWKGMAAVAALVVLAAGACAQFGRINPGPAPDFRDSGALHYFAGGRWRNAPAVPGGVENLAVSTTGAVWTMNPARTAVLRWDGVRWMHYAAAQIGSAHAKRVVGLALRGEEAWVATDDGVAWFDGRNWRSHQVALMADPGAIAAGPSGVWLIDRAAGLAHFDGNNWTFENLRSTPAGANWDERMEDAAPQLAVTADGALWLLLDGVWRKDESGWRERPIGNVDWSSAVLAAHSGNNIWLSTPGYVFEVRPDNSFGRLYRRRDLPIASSYGLFDVAAAGNSTWFATSKNLLESRDGRWQRHGLPPGGTVMKEVAAAPDGGVWVVSENRPIWRIALWVARPLMAVLLVLLSIGALAVVWAGGASKKRWAAHHATIKAAGIVQRREDAETEKTLEKRDRALWWKLPAFLGGFPYLVKGVEWSRLYFEDIWPGAPNWVSWAAAVFPVAAVVIFLAVRWLRQWSKPTPALSTETLLIRLVLCLAVVSFFVARVPPELAVLKGAAIAVTVLVLLRNSMASRWTTPLRYSGQYDRGLARLRWFCWPRPTAWMTFQKGALLSAAGRHAEAEQCYRQVLAVSAHAKPAFRNHLLLCLGYTWTNLGRYEEARRCLEVLIDLGDAQGGARLGIADLLLQQSREAQRALSLVEESMRICSAGWYGAERMGNKAWALALMGKREEISEPLAAALQGAHGLQHVGAAASIHWRAGKALAAAERVSEAIEQFRAALQIDPHGHHGLLARTELLNCGTAEL